MPEKHDIPLTRRQLAGSLFWGIVAILAGWTGFGWWWYEVLAHDQPRALVVLVLLVLLFSGLILLATLAWIWHNRRLAARGQRGRAARWSAPRFRRDALGRDIVLPPPGELSRARVVKVSAASGRKQFLIERREAS